ncbi:unnamed protein product [Withania somnifera]
MTILKACKVLGVNVSGFEHEFFDIILSGGKEKITRSRTKPKTGDQKKGKSKSSTELKKFAWGLQEGSGRKEKVRFESLTEDFKWVFTGVTKEERIDLWHELAAVRGLWSDMWVIGGYFNVCRFEEDRRNCIRRSKAMRGFSNS